MNYQTVVEELTKEVTEIVPLYTSELELWGNEDPGPHNIFGNVFNPFLIKLLNENNDIELLSRIFLFLEKMAGCEDVMVRDLLGATILERLGDDGMILDIATSYMGIQTSKMSDEVERGWGRK